MHNFNNLSDIEFEGLCKDIMEKKLGVPLRIFGKGRDGGIDITDDVNEKNVVIQVKHYINSTYSNLSSSLKKEVDKVKSLNPKEYYICCSVKLTPKNIQEIYEMFEDYMRSSKNIISLIDINDFLEKPENIDIVRKNYKLWLESSNILNEIYNQNIFIDCESLLYNIDELSKEFVETKYYKECIDILNKDGNVLLLGMPGVGKTMTTKMLALYYASEGYVIRYTTNGDIKDIKKSISLNKEQKEVILIDDCFGQHYFKMNETQTEELVSLIKYVSFNNNKKIILNSRVTIYNEAKENHIEFRQFTEDKKVHIRILNMNNISLVDKGKIFYNHIYFNKLTKPHFDNIKLNRNYINVVSHRNYTPRIIEHVTRRASYQGIASEEYTEYIINSMNNPLKIWSDEFGQRIQPEDRMFMTTLYSLTDTSVEEEIIKRSFNNRLRNSLKMDTTKNIYEEVVSRLTGSMIIIFDKNNKKEIGVINPSVNDFLQEYLKENELEKESIYENATEYEQIKRLFPDEMLSIVKSGDANILNYLNKNEEVFIVLSYVCRYHIFNDSYKYTVEVFFDQLTYGYYDGMLNRIQILIMLLTEEFEAFYDTRSKMTYDNLEYLLEDMDLFEYESLIEGLKKYNLWFLIDEYEELFIRCLNYEIIKYCEDVQVDDYLHAYDIDELIYEHIHSNGEYENIDISPVVEKLIERIKDDLEDEVYNIIAKLPSNIKNEIICNRESIDVSSFDIENYIDSYYEPDDDWAYDEWRDNNRTTSFSEINALDYIFDR